jgi:hypothetical protein
MVIRRKERLSNIAFQVQNVLPSKNFQTRLRAPDQFPVGGKRQDYVT